MTVLFEPASAVAAGICLTARTLTRDGIHPPRHPRPCGWCDYPLDALRSMLEGYNEWAGFKERSRTYERHEARVFQDLSAARQAELVLEAQSFPPLPEPVEAVPTPADPDALPAFFTQEVRHG